MRTDQHIVHLKRLDINGKWIFDNGVEVYHEDDAPYFSKSFYVYCNDEYLGEINARTEERAEKYIDLMDCGCDPVEGMWDTGDGTACSWSGWGRDKEKAKGKKKINIQIEFDPDFVPPERYDNDICSNHQQCPFITPDVDGGEYCGFPNEDEQVRVRCPLLKYFK
uniref:Uncharacterized protein n=1 Tax=Myoviridae sp. ctBvM24 TaxID=2825050 RepID=A0A8S5UD23_9CAUD|nr:MAG TPA: hypothetical protein [Myoviridae sp. ctBvM24]